MLAIVAGKRCGYGSGPTLVERWRYRQYPMVRPSVPPELFRKLREVLVIAADNAPGFACRESQLVFIFDAQMPELVGAGNIDAQAAGNKSDLL